MGARGLYRATYRESHDIFLQLVKEGRARYEVRVRVQYEYSYCTRKSTRLVTRDSTVCTSTILVLGTNMKYESSILVGRDWCKENR